MSKPDKIISYAHTAVAMQSMFWKLDDTIGKTPASLAIGSQFIAIANRIRVVITNDHTGYTKNNKGRRS